MLLSVLSSECHFCSFLPFPHGAMGWSVVCDLAFLGNTHLLLNEITLALLTETVVQDIYFAMIYCKSGIFAKILFSRIALINILATRNFRG